MALLLTAGRAFFAPTFRFTWTALLERVGLDPVAYAEALGYRLHLPRRSACN